MRQFRLHFVRYCSRLSAKFTSNLLCASMQTRRTIWHFHRPTESTRKTNYETKYNNSTEFIYFSNFGTSTLRCTHSPSASLCLSLSFALVWPSVENSKRPKIQNDEASHQISTEKRMKFQRKHTHTHTEHAGPTHTQRERKIRELIMQQMMRTEGFRRMPPCIGCVRWCAMKFNSSSLSERTQESAG